MSKKHVHIKLLLTAIDPKSWVMTTQEDSNADGLKENVCVIYDDDSHGEEIMRTPTHSDPPARGRINENSINHARYAIHAANQFPALLSAFTDFLKLVDNDVIRVRPSERDAFIEALTKANEAVSNSENVRL